MTQPKISCVLEQYKIIGVQVFQVSIEDTLK